MSFEPKLYKKIYGDLAKYSNSDLKKHYNKSGKKEGRIGSREDFYNLHPNFDFLYYTQRYEDLKKVLTNEYNAIAHYIRFGITEGRETHAIEQQQPAPVPVKFGANILGFFKGAFGEAELPRQIAYGLHKLNVPFFANEVVEASHDFNINYTVNLSRKHNYNINIICLKWSVPDDFVPNSYGSEYMKNKINIPVWTFETDTMLRTTVPKMNSYNKIFTISNFCQNTINKEDVNKDVLALNIPTDNTKLDMPRNQIVDYFNKKYKLGITHDCFICGMIFDYSSSINRKNPFDVLTTFDQSIAHHNNTLLILKTVGRAYKEKSAKKLKAHINKLKYPQKVIIINNTFSETELNMFYSIINAYIYLHRSEGLGLTILRCISTGIPTICTAYSGSLDFSNKFNSFLVPYSKIDIPADDPAYSQFHNISKWAQPDVQVAKKHLSHIYNNYEECLRNLQKSKVYTDTKFNIERLGHQVLGSIINLSSHKLHNKKVLIITHVNNKTVVTNMLASNKSDFAELLLFTHTDTTQQQANFTASWTDYKIKAVQHLKTNNMLKFDFYFFIDNINILSSLNSIMNYSSFNKKLGVVGIEKSIPMYDLITITKLCNIHNIPTDFSAVYKLLDNQTFEHSTYINTYSDTHNMTEINASEHWLKVGQAQNRICCADLLDYMTFNNCPLFAGSTYGTASEVVNLIKVDNLTTTNYEFDMSVNLVVFNMKWHTVAVDKFNNIRFYK